MAKHFSAADVEAHQLRNHGAVKCTCGAQGAKEAFENLSGLERHESHADTCPLSVIAALPGGGIAVATPEKPAKPRMNKTETEYSHILEARRLRGEIVEWKFEGMSLSWGRHPDNGKPMWYTGDFVVWPVGENVELHEIKGGHIFEKDRIRFRGCRAEWGMHFRFRMIQKKAGEWKQIE